ncbi:hypothetical protein E2C01_048734 [Portunus trituberculatus]|uniref:Uncharacterized protein n=1 Tax=Portunus trituberculatus TaxID=210409 RepID=A0A5B7GBS7_PORTR|nr:hypothetical protein [Portunus trituberculatus]
MPLPPEQFCASTPWAAQRRNAERFIMVRFSKFLPGDFCLASRWLRPGEAVRTLGTRAALTFHQQ